MHRDCVVAVFVTTPFLLCCLCRNLPGVEVSSVERLNLLQLAPGGHMGRFVIFTKSAFDSLDKIFGESTGFSDGGGGAGSACLHKHTWCVFYFIIINNKIFYYLLFGES